MKGCLEAPLAEIAEKPERHRCLHETLMMGALPERLARLDATLAAVSQVLRRDEAVDR